MRSRATATDKRFYGVYEGVVTSVDKDKSKEGRVIVQLPWFDDQTEFECRVLQTYAGDGFGAFLIPEVKTEVLVAFCQGDMRIPIIVGVLYNGVSKPPTFRAKDKDEKMLRTKAGHQIILDDTKGKEKIVILDKSEKNKILIDTTDDSITVSCSSGKLKLDAKAGIEIESAGEVNIKGSKINLN